MSLKALACEHFNVGGHYSRVLTLSRIRTLLVIAASLAGVTPLRAQAATPHPQKASTGSDHDPAGIFARAERALAAGRLDEAELDFKRVLALDPQAASAYANLGVIHMRRKHWDAALASLQSAEKLAPQLTGIRLNIGLANYRKGDYRHAIQAFESVVRDAPDSLQARYLLGQCYFFTDRYVEAVDVLEAIWPQQSTDLNYLYVLSTAADKAERKDLSDRALARMAEVGGDSPMVHMLIGKAMLNLEAYDDAAKELSAAEQADPKLPFVHFNLGLLYSKKGDYQRAKSEFLKDIALEPDVPFNYEELGNAYVLLNENTEAEKNYGQALRLDPRMLNSRLGLAKIYQTQEEYAKALTALDAAAKLDPESSRIHYLRGQILLRMGKKIEGKKEIEASVRMSSARRDKRQKELEADPVPSPELTRDPK